MLLDSNQSLGVFARMILPMRRGLCLLIFLSWGLAAHCVESTMFRNFETAQVHPMDLSPDGRLLGVCNTADGRLELFDVAAGTPTNICAIPVGYDPVSVRFRSDKEAWVVNGISDTISVVDLVTKNVSATVATLDEPADVIFAGVPERAFVSCRTANVIQVFVPETKALVSNVKVYMEEPRALAKSVDGSVVYALSFRSGNGTTIVNRRAVSDVESPYGGVNPPPNGDISNLDPAMRFNPPLSAEAMSNKTYDLALIVRKESASGRWLDDNGEDWTPWVSGEKADLTHRYSGWDLLDHDVAIIDAETLDVSYCDSLMTIGMAVAVQPGGQITVVGTEAINEVRYEPVLTGVFSRVMMAFCDSITGIKSPVLDLNKNHLEAAQFAQDGVADAYHDGEVPQSGRDMSIGDPRGVVWRSDGKGYVSGRGSNNVIPLLQNGSRSSLGASIEVGEGPTGLVLSRDEKRLYVLNQFSASISVIDTANDSIVSTIPFFDPTPDIVKVGRKHLYDTHKNSGLGHVGCASCHPDGRMDRLAWDLGKPDGDIKPLNGVPGQHNLGAGIVELRGAPMVASFEDFHPLKGPMTTQTLQDIIGKEPHHWLGDKDGLEEFNDAFIDLQGDDTNLTSREMQEFEDFLATIHFPPNPFRNLDNSLPIDLPLTDLFYFAGESMPNGNALEGLALFRDLSTPLATSRACVLCHTLPLGNGSDMFYNGTSFDEIPKGPNGENHVAIATKPRKIPQLRSVYEKTGFTRSKPNTAGPGGTPSNLSLSGYGLSHDGSVDSVVTFVSVFQQVESKQDAANVVALLLAFSGGFDFIASQPGEFPFSQLSNDAHAAVGTQVTIDGSKTEWSPLGELAALADTGAIDLVAKRSEGGVQRGWVYAGDETFQSDRGDEQTLLADLVGTAIGKAEVTFSAVPVGMGQRIGVDRDGDGIFDFDEIRDMDSSEPGVQNPYDPNDDDCIGDSGLVEPDGVPDGRNDFDGDGRSDSTELLAGDNPLFNELTTAASLDIAQRR